MDSIKIDSDFGLILNCAVRYGLGRRTYITEFICDYIKPLITKLETRDLIVIRDSIERQRNNALIDKPLGDECDEEAWNSLSEAINEELKKRENC